MTKKYVVELTDEERAQLIDLTSKGSTSARKIKRAHILLLAEAGKTDLEISQSLHTSVSTVERIRENFVENSLDRALNERSRPGRHLMLNGKQEAYLIALACSAPPPGRKCWTMQLLADRLVELGVIGSISDETVRLWLKKRYEALATRRMVHSVYKCRIHLAHGRCSRFVC